MMLNDKKPPFVIHISEMADFPDAVYIGRAMPRRRLQASKFANPFKITGNIDRAEAVDLFRLHITVGEGRHLDLGELTGRPIACWCRRSDEERTAANACHGDVLVELWLDTYFGPASDGEQHRSRKERTMTNLRQLIRRELAAAYDNGAFAATNDVITTKAQIVETGESRILQAITTELTSPSVLAQGDRGCAKPTNVERVVRNVLDAGLE